MKHLAVFVSGTGSNCDNLIRYFQHSNDIEVSLVLSNKVDAPALSKAAQWGTPTAHLPKDSFMNPNHLLPLLHQHHIDFIVLAGFLLLIPPFLIAAYPHRIINLHPALLPKFGGKGMYGRHVHEAVKAAQETETGMTVHWVSEICDGGDIITQYKVPLSPLDTVDDIAAKEHQLEMAYFPQVVEAIVRDTFAPHL